MLVVECLMLVLLDVGYVAMHDIGGQTIVLKLKALHRMLTPTQSTDIVYSVCIVLDYSLWLFIVKTFLVPTLPKREVFPTREEEIRMMRLPVSRWVVGGTKTACLAPQFIVQRVSRVIIRDKKLI